MPSRRTPASTRMRSPRPIAIAKERRALIEQQIAQLSTTARAVAVELPMSADVGDFLRVLEEAERG